jgi:threonine aldolase
MAIEVDLYSDTVTRPTLEMRRFMCEAEVGDEQKQEDPTVNLLQEMVAELLGKEAALFLPSGTMCNEIALRVHCRPGEEMLAHKSAHPIHFEAGGPAALAGVNVQSLEGPRGQYDVAALEAAIRPDSRHMPRSRLVWIEQTSNLGGGSIWPLETVRAVAGTARARGLTTHMDGARLMNAVVASGDFRATGPSPSTRRGSTSQGLGAPWARLSPARGTSSPRPGGASSRWAGHAPGRHHRRGWGVRPAASRQALADDHVNASVSPRAGRAPASRSIRPPSRPTSSSSISRALSAPTAVERMLGHGVRMGALGPRTVER